MSGDGATSFVAVADHAVLVGFAEEASDDVTARVRAFDRALTEAAVEGVIESVPAYVNVLVVFDPLATDHDAVIERVRPIADRSAAADPITRPSRRVVVPFCHDADLAPDLPALAAELGLSESDVLRTFSAAALRVEMFGFQPGCAYLRGVPPSMRVPRKPAPVSGVPAGSVIVAGAQCLVTTLTMPTGWWVIGRSPVEMLTDDEAHPTAFDVGDEVEFRPVDRATYEALLADRTGGR